jgi:uncharacterized protein DUF1553/uncharacterized protein DUF1549/cytochrome c/concanavalin A-like lectin/glucanase superfamily protein
MMNPTNTKLKRPLVVWTASLLAVALACAVARAEQDIQFNRDIRPFFSDNCYACHGPDPAQRKAGMRLDRPEGLFEKHEHGPAVVPGKPEESQMIQRIFTDDPDDVMPPPKANKKITPQQKELLKKWVEQGAKWEPHWSFIPPVRPAAPDVSAQFSVLSAQLKKAAGKSDAPGNSGTAEHWKLSTENWSKNPIDAFILKKLAEAGLEPAPEASPETLCRRLYLDLTGLPPKPDDVDAFVQSAIRDPQSAIESLVDRLLASPHYGEHRARYWLDAARYADTHGLHFDNYREMWPYRDWVVNAFNKNMPFDQFTVEQLAGDLLPNPTLEQRIATGFHRCNITTNEGGTIPDENLANYARDRVETTGETWLGLTLGCCVCHDHKFDPITNKEFYQFTAFFRNTTQGALDGNKADTMPIVTVPGEKDAPRWNALLKETNGAREKMAAREKEIAPALAAWVKEVRPAAFDQPAGTDKLDLYLPLRSGAGRAIWNEAATDGALIDLPDGAQWQLDAKLGPYLTLQEKTSIELGDAGDVDWTGSFSYGAWVKPDDKLGQGTVLARMDDDDAFRGWDLSIERGRRVLVHLINHWPDNGLKVSSEKDVLKPNDWNHVFVTYDGTGKPDGVKVYVNGATVPLRVENKTLRDTIRTKVPTRLGARNKSWNLANAGVQDVRFYRRKLAPEEVARIFDAAELRTLAASPANTPNRDAKLHQFYLATQDEPYQNFIKQLAKLDAEQQQIRARNPLTHVMQEKETPPKAFVLFRGQYDQPRDEVEPAVLAALNPLPEGAPMNRLGLARWLVAPENPLTARVTVNRFWQEIFGTGIVKTAEDFGIMGENPSHPELLDWLAVEFRDSGWDVKRIFKLIVTSAAYRQAAVATPEKIERDPQNRLLSRGPRFRMDGEMLRDYALVASGLLVPKLGGPSVKPYQPEGVWEAVAISGSNTRFYKQDSGESLYRRSLYTFWKRSAPNPSMEIFNAPTRETCTVRRERTNTPLQALVTLNDPQFIEAARHLAERALKEGGETNESRLDFIAKRLLGRRLRAEERPVVAKTVDKLVTYYQSHDDDAKKLVEVGESKSDPALEPPLLAAWTMTANELMNLDEVLNK